MWKFEESDLQDRCWVTTPELVGLSWLPYDPSLEADLEQMGGEMIDPWGR